MVTAPIRILLVEDNPADALLLTEALADAGECFDVTHVEMMREALERLRSGSFDGVLLDLFLPDSRGLDTLERAHSAAPHLPIVVLTGLDDETTGIEAVRRGAQDFLTKGHAGGHLLSRSIRYAMERKRAEEEIRKLNAELESRVIERTALAEQRANQLRALASDLILTEERERRRLAEILHDHLQQILYAARLSLGALKCRLHDLESRPMLQRIDELLRESIEASRSLTVELSPPILFHGGLAGSLEWLAQHVQERYGLRIEADVDPDAEVPTDDMRVLLFQAVRELLFNVVKHAKVQTARVAMTGLHEDRIRIEVADEAAGFDAAALETGQTRTAGFGLFAIHERLGLIGGRMEIESTPGKGTRVVLWAPCREPTEAPSGRDEASRRRTQTAANSPENDDHEHQQ